MSEEARITLLVEFDAPNSTEFKMQTNASPWQLVALAAHLEAVGKQGIADFILQQRMSQVQAQQQLAQVSETLKRTQ